MKYASDIFKDMPDGSEFAKRADDPMIGTYKNYTYTVENGTIYVRTENGSNAPQSVIDEIIELLLDEDVFIHKIKYTSPCYDADNIIEGVEFKTRKSFFGKRVEKLQANIDKAIDA